MSEEIINKVANSGLITLDLSEYKNDKEIKELDVKSLLHEGIILKEKEFRKNLKEFDFKKYSKKNVAIYCSSEAILPMWAYMLITSYLKVYTSNIYFGSSAEVLQKIILKNVLKIKAEKFKNKKVIVKGCGDIVISESIFIAITSILKNNVSSLMFGEACSSVPIYKKKKNES